MKKILSIMLVAGLAMTAMAIPAKRGWQTRTQADGTAIEVQTIGDEHFHFTINRDGKQVRLNEQGMYEVVGDAPSQETISARRANSRRAPQAQQEFGVTPNLAPRGIVIMVNFSDKSFKTTNTNAKVDSLCNALDCKVNGGYPSAGQYFADQSNGTYRPYFDVYGPVTLSNNMKYYGANDSQGNDMRPAVAVVEACKLLDSEVDFTKYDSDNDGKIDFVYMLYAGTGENETETANEIWPHAFSIDEEFEYQDTNFTNVYSSKNDCKVDGKQINKYACSAELEGSSLCGIGTLCHEFSHVCGLPDLYDTQYGTNYENAITPNDWDVMDGGAYNGDGHCPPNYSAWEKYFMGWHTPINQGSSPFYLELVANGQAGYQAYQVNASGNLQTATTSGLCYYLENRQQKGWDKGLPYHGLIIWKVNYNKTKWMNNEPNNTNNKPLLTIVSAYGTAIGTHLNSAGKSYVYDGKNNSFPGAKNVTSWEDVTGKPITGIEEVNGVIRFSYMNGQQGIEDVESDEAAVKFLRDGQVLIQRNGVTYTVQGAIVK